MRANPPPACAAGIRASLDAVIGGFRSRGAATWNIAIRRDGAAGGFTVIFP
jgi:hypothetical protein